jgi:ubiquinone/menaquinone biosynthesis C-methylase UbiE
MAQGAHVVALDRSLAMLQQADDLPMRVVARAERTPFEDASFDMVSAGQCWHWFDREAAAMECRRLLRPGGTLVIAHFDYLALPGNVAHETERLLLRANPTWGLGGHDGMYEHWRPELTEAAFSELTSWFYEEDVTDSLSPQS